MIITCPSCKKKFNIDADLIPVEGRDLQCGACDKVWFYKNNNQTTEPLNLNQNEPLNESKTNIINNITNETPDVHTQVVTEKIKNEEDEIIVKQIEEEQPIRFEKKEKKRNIKFFSYLIVLIISFVALIVLVDTLKTPLINVFPGLEMILFNLFETLKDIKLFIIDLS